MLASDVDNQEFMNPQRPDAALHVEFYMYDPLLKRKSDEAGKEIRLGKKIPFIRIARPGDQTTVLEVAVRDEHKIRFPHQWMAFQIKQGLVEGPIAIGWKIEEWDEVKDNEIQIHELKYKRFETVEQIAGASDAQIQQLGIGGLGLREKAKQAIKDRNKAEFKEEMDQKDKLISDLSARLAKLEAAAMPVEVKHETEVKPLPKRRGRPPKVKVDG